MAIVADAFAKLERVKEFFPNATIYINAIRGIEIYRVLLKNNPFIKSLLSIDWINLQFTEYDLVISVSDDEILLDEILQNLSKKGSSRERHLTLFNWSTSSFSSGL